MRLNTSNDFIHIESGLSMLLNRYNNQPSNALAKSIHYYLNKLLNHDDINYCGDRRCDYLNMRRFWQWQAMKVRLP